MPMFPRDLEGQHRIWEIGANDQIFKAVEYAPLAAGFRNGRAVRISAVRPSR